MSTTAAPARQHVPGPRRDAGPEEAVDTVIDEACRSLHLPTIRGRVSEMAVGVHVNAHSRVRMNVQSS